MSGEAPDGGVLCGADHTQLRRQIDELDREIIRRCLERLRLSREIVRARCDAGGPPIDPDREQAIVSRYRAALGGDGAQLAMLLLRAGRGPG